MSALMFLSVGPFRSLKSGFRKVLNLKTSRLTFQLHRFTNQMLFIRFAFTIKKISTSRNSKLLLIRMGDYICSLRVKVLKSGFQNKENSLTLFQQVISYPGTESFSGLMCKMNYQSTFSNKVKQPGIIPNYCLLYTSPSPRD